MRKLEYIDLATCLDDLKVPPGNRLHELERDRKGSIPLPSTTNGASEVLDEHSEYSGKKDPTDASRRDAA
jgi:hypothetical protein